MLKSGPAAGIFWMCMATLISSISGAMVRELAGEIPTFELVFFRNVIAMTVLIPIVLRQGVGLPDRSQLPYYGMRIVFAFSAMVFLFYALARMPLADVYALQYTIPLFTILLAVMFLRQKADIHSWAAVFVGFVGTLIVMRPGIIEITLAALGAITAACLSAGSNTTIKILARKDNAEAITLWTNIGMLPLALIPTVFVWVTPTAEQWPLIIGVGVVSSIGGYCFTRAVSAADARIVQPFQFSRMVFATAIGWIMFSEFPDLWTWIGAAVIFGASYYIVYREGLARKAAQANQQATD